MVGAENNAGRQGLVLGSPVAAHTLALANRPAEGPRRCWQAHTNPEVAESLPQHHAFFFDLDCDWLAWHVAVSYPLPVHRQHRGDDDALRCPLSSTTSSLQPHTSQGAATAAGPKR